MRLPLKMISIVPSSVSDWTIEVRHKFAVSRYLKHINPRRNSHSIQIHCRILRQWKQNTSARISSWIIGENLARWNNKKTRTHWITTLQKKRSVTVNSVSILQCQSASVRVYTNTKNNIVRMKLITDLNSGDFLRHSNPRPKRREIMGKK